MMEGALEWNEELIDDAVLALLILGLHDGNRVWKSFDWDALRRLHERGLISDPVCKAKSVTLSDEGLQKVRELRNALFSKACMPPGSRNVHPLSDGQRERTFFRQR